MCRKIMKIVKNNKNLIIVVAILIAGFSVLLYIQNKQNELIRRLIKATEGTDRSVQNVDSSVNALINMIHTGNNGQVDWISDYTIDVKEPNFDSMTADLNIEIIPKEFSANTKAKFYIDGQAVELKAKDNKYVGTATVSILKNYSKASVSFAKKSGVNNTTLSVNISFTKYFTEQSTALFEGERNYSSGEYTFDGSILYNRTDHAFDPILSSKLVRKVNGVVQWSKELPITNVEGEQKFTFQQSFPLQAGGTFELYIEQVSKTGFTYHYFIGGGTVEEDDTFNTEEREIKCEVVDQHGTPLIEK